MASSEVFLTVTAIGGPTAKIQVGGRVFVTDPTFDPPGTYGTAVVLRKTVGPALSADEVGPVDVVLLSHDQHADNLDTSGRRFLGRAGRVLTTVAGAQRLGGAEGLAPWAFTEVDPGTPDALRITATPARHGPSGIEPLTGDVTGFVVTHVATGRDLFYVTGDTCWFEGTAAVAQRFRPEVVFLFGGAAETRGPFHLTMDCNDALETAAAFSQARLLLLHHDGWAHFTQSGNDFQKAFEALGQSHRLEVLVPGVPWAGPSILPSPDTIARR